MHDATGLQIIVDSGLFILIWLVQLIIYPSFRFIDNKAFIGWHGRYTSTIGLIVTPLMLLEAGVEIMNCLSENPRWLRILLIALIWLSTFSLSVPCHSILHREGKDLTTINRLVMTNWVRTLLWTILFLETLSIFL